jgi:hypothetical protein
MVQQPTVQLAYVESWDRREFPHLPTKLSLKDLAFALLGNSIGTDGQSVEFKRERVVATGEGEVLRGQVTLAEAIVESWCADNPVLFVALIQGWIEQARAADDGDRKFSQKWEERLSYSPHLAAALEAGIGAVCERAGLTAFQTRAVEMMLSGKTPTEIAFALGLNSRQAAHDRISKALERIMALDLPVSEEIAGVGA